ncbi:MAG: HAMP domain-containing histidine kinase [Phycisphaerales bacterium]|nr:HAMP domain-containing histidine kinase [Phycisphaerales bacterium]MCI0675918.1 HAMP domain-containing histidine kinase [Phycisphaerales bacterium]
MPELPAYLSQQDLLGRLRQAEAELAALQHEFEHSNRLATLGTLAAGVAHEINNILTPVLAYAQMACNTPGDKQLQIKALQKAIQGVQTATQITQAMLGFAGSPDEPTVANLGDVLQASIDCIGRDPEKDRIKLTVNIHPQTWVQIRPLALQQILMNLILNACSAMHGRGGELSISASNAGDGMTTIRISDNGPGIPSDVASRLFEPFATGHRQSKKPSSSPRKTDGTGLGLAICKRLVEEASGTIAATSTSGSGTTFTINLRSGSIQKKAG